MSTSRRRGPGEQWPALESVGLSRKELALAEALQMEYDALSRLRQDKEESRARKEQLQERSLISWDDPVDRSAIKAARGLSGSDPALSHAVPNVPEGPQVPPGPSTPRMEPQPWKGPLSGDYLLIFEGSQRDFLGEPLNGSEPHEGGGSPKKLSPPPLPPRHPLWGCPESSQRSPLSPKSQAQPRDINMFSVAQDKLVGRRISQEDPYGVDAITCLNLKSTYESEALREGSRGWKEGRSILEKESSGKPVARSKTMPPQVPPRTYGARAGGRKNLAANRNRRISVEPVAPRPHSLANGYELFEVSEERDEEVAAFCHMLDVLRSSCGSRGCSGSGLVWNAVNVSPEQPGHGVSLKVTVLSDSLREPLTFTCDCSSTVDLLIYQALCYTHDELHAVDVEDFLLKICGLEEFLQNKHALGSHEHIQHCRKFDIDIRLQLLRRKGVRSDLARTASDDQSPSTLNHHIHLQERPIKQTISRQALSLLFDTFHNEVDAFLAAEGDVPLKAERVIQSVMAICNALAAVESQEITAALNQMPPCPSRMQPKIQKVSTDGSPSPSPSEKIVESLTAAILNLVELYCSTFNADFQTAAPGSRELGVAQEARLLTCPLAFTVYATHRIPITWAASYEDFYLSCSLSHGGKELCSPLLTRKAHVYKYLFHLIIWDQQICFPVQVNRLPRETLLSVTLFAVPVPPPGGSCDTNKQRRVPEALGWVTTPLFNFRQVLTCGRKLLGLWPATQDNSRARSSAPNFNQPDSVILQIDFPTSAFEVKFTSPPAAEPGPSYDFGSLGEEDQRQLREAMQKKSLYWLTDADRQRLWEKRCHCHASPGALPMLLASAPGWDWGCLPDIYALLSQWSSMSHQDALGLLHATFPDQEVRRTAVQWIDSISDTELLDYLPQLVQALKYECYLDSPLVRFLMKRAICDLKITHYFFWLLKDGLKDSQFSIRYQYLLAALLCCCGKGLREEFDRQCLLVSTLARLAQQVRDAAPSARQVGAGCWQGCQGVLGASPLSHITPAVPCLPCPIMVLPYPMCTLCFACYIPCVLHPMLIESSLGSVATKLNFFIHNLAQMKFAGSEARPTLSFAPRTHTLKTSGRIRDVFLCRHERVFNPSKGYTYVVKVQRDSPGDVTFVQRTFEEFQELHNKLRLLFPSSLLPSFPSRFVIGRSRGEAVAERRKEELNGYIWHLIHAAPEVAECDLIYTFFHPLPRDEKAAGTNPTPKPADATWARSLGKVGGEVKLSISYKNNKLFIMVMHIRGLPPLQDGNDPDPYVKTYLLPDPQKTTKRKTKVARKTCNPTYNEMLVYDGIPRGDLEQRELRLSVLSEEGFWENILLGEVGIRLRDLDLAQEKMGWFALGSRGHGTL
uniref:Phosphatidylinositol-4-phosphate 3-kinase catalytic subunit type 2 beta n=1 Tax=Junco hyemalis TaxID=40217 RepID=A0A8C5IDM5_JUNHY